MSRWIIPAGAVAILISLAALGILLAANSSAPPEDVSEVQQTEEPEIPPQTTPDQEQDLEGGGLTTPEEQPPAGEETTQEGQSAQGDQATQGGQTTQQGAPAPVPPGPSTATIEVRGDSAYYCSLGAIGEPETIQGRVPRSYEVQVETGGTALDTVMAACQKISPGTLGVLIRYDGEVVARDETDARLGTVSVSWNPLEE